MDNSRLDDLRRRVQQDPASIAFAQLAEECRRAGLFDEAIATCRTGLARHPGYISARVTLGRSLLQAGQLDAAFAELQHVTRLAPENLAALRSLADVRQRRGEFPEALAVYRRALRLAPNDPEIERLVHELEGPVREQAARLERERNIRIVQRLEQWLSRIHAARA